MNEKIKSYEYNSEYGRPYTVAPELGIYVDNNNLSLRLNYYDEDYGYWEPFSSVTVNTTKLPYLHAAIDTNNNGEEILDFLEQNGFGHRTAAVSFSGFCAYPIFRFNEAKLRSIDLVVFDDYAEAHGRGKKSLDAKIDAAKSKTEPPRKENVVKEQER